jgi:hypothetical protein
MRENAGGRARRTPSAAPPTTRIGRRTGRDPVDLGTEELMARKKIAANGSGAAVELVDYPAILLAHHPISQEDQMMLATVATWLDRVRRARNLSSTSVGGLWAAILSGQGSSRKWTVPITSPEHRDMAGSGSANCTMVVPPSCDSSSSSTW